MFWKKRTLGGEREHVLKQGEGTQLQLNVPAGKGEFWYGLKFRISQSERIFENLPFWRSWVHTFAIVTIIATASASFAILFRYWERLPLEMPVFYSQSQGNWGLYPKFVILISALVIVMLQLAVFICAFKVYSFDRRLAAILSATVMVSGFLFVVSLAELTTLVVY